MVFSHFLPKCPVCSRFHDQLQRANGTWGWHGALGRGLKVRFRVGASPRRNLKFSTLKGVAFDLFSEIKGSHLICFPVSLLIFHWKKRVAFIMFGGWCCI